MDRLHGEGDSSGDEDQGLREGETGKDYRN